MSIKIPEPNGSLMLAWQIRNRHVLLVGGGAVAVSRIELLLQADAKVTVVAPKIDPTIEEYEKLGLLYKVHRRKFLKDDLKMYEGEASRKLDQFFGLDQFGPEETEQIEQAVKQEQFALVLTAIDDKNLSRQIYYWCKAGRMQVNIADKPKQCDFYFGSVVRQGSIQIMISSNGKSPRLCHKLKHDKLEPLLASLDAKTAVDNLGKMRGELRHRVAPGEDTPTIKERMAWNTQVTDLFTIEEWGQFDDTALNRLLSFYPKVPQRQDIIVVPLENF
ncbi:BA75_00841T0 [Komagataella pastoris]|uniref:precorrin-2 dehydrogenase n=1 Tax=Komagataella pastoris TaxID=4922 RepID=A0A1B2J969_PICPA|nr:BA75_00841T0 [Komagataella pastoris]